MPGEVDAPAEQAQRLLIGYGTEWDFEASYETPWKQKVGLIAAAYDADAFSTSTTKLWLWTSWTL